MTHPRLRESRQSLAHHFRGRRGRRDRRTAGTRSVKACTPPRRVRVRARGASRARGQPAVCPEVRRAGRGRSHERLELRPGLERPTHTGLPSCGMRSGADTSASRPACLRQLSATPPHSFRQTRNRPVCSISLRPPTLGGNAAVEREGRARLSRQRVMGLDREARTVIETRRRRYPRSVDAPTSPSRDAHSERITRQAAYTGCRRPGPRRVSRP